MTASTVPTRARPSVMSFIDNTLERHSAKRSDKAWLDGLLARDDARVALSTANRLILPEGDGQTISHTLDAALSLGADRNELVLLGSNPDGTEPLFATTIAKSDEEIESLSGVRVTDLRTLALEGAFSKPDLSVLSQARALIHWHRTHQFCSRCGHKTEMAEAGYRRDCPSCGGQHFPRTDPCVIMLISDGERALLGRPARLAEGIYTTLAGFMEPGETIEQAVRRETLEESAIQVGEVRMVSNQPWPFPANLMLGCYGKALTTDIQIEDDELEACGWYTRDEVRQMLEGSHPLSHHIPPPISISYELIVDWLNGTGWAP